MAEILHNWLAGFLPSTVGHLHVCLRAHGTSGTLSFKCTAKTSQGCSNLVGTSGDSFCISVFPLCGVGMYSMLHKCRIFSHSLSTGFLCTCVFWRLYSCCTISGVLHMAPVTMALWSLVMRMDYVESGIALPGRPFLAIFLSCVLDNVGNIICQESSLAARLWCSQQIEASGASTKQRSCSHRKRSEE